VRYTGVSRRRRLLTSTIAGIGAVALPAGIGVAFVAGRPPPASSTAAAEVVIRPASGIWVVDGHGYGHGRGMSQWGARAAAAQGLSAERILAFYYRGTTGRRIGDPTIRVSLGTGPGPVVRSAAGLRLTWPGRQVALPTAGVLRWQVAVSGSGLRMKYRATSGALRWWGPALPAQVDVRSAAATLRMVRGDGTSSAYRGVLTAVRSGSASITVNRLPLDTYLRGVVPRESPASWPLQALRAQAVAARTYAYRAIQAPRSRSYDICDSTSCQVYGGAARYSPGGSRLYGEQASTDRAIATTAGRVLTAGGRVATTEYSASHGGWIAYGGTSYLPGMRDPYRAGDPYMYWRVRVRVVDVGRWLGFSRLDRLQVLGRDGQGEWGGRVVQVRLSGLDGAGKPRARTVSGSLLRSALGVRSTYFRLRTG
jgi:stage II sporulation protein D